MQSNGYTFRLVTSWVLDKSVSTRLKRTLVLFSITMLASCGDSQVTTDGVTTNGGPQVTNENSATTSSGPSSGTSVSNTPQVNSEDNQLTLDETNVSRVSRASIRDFNTSNLAVTGSGDWISLWSTNEYNNKQRIKVSNIVDGEWQRGQPLATDASNGVALAASENYAMAAWIENIPSAPNEIRTSLFSNGEWSSFPNLLPSTDTYYSPTILSLHSLPDDGYAMFMTRVNEEELRDQVLLTVWRGNVWSDAQVVTEVGYQGTGIVTSRGEMSFVYSLYNPEIERSNYWLKDNVADQWQDAVLLTTQDIPVWLEIFKVDRPVVATSSNGQQVAVWSVQMFDFYNTPYYAIAVRKRDAVGEAWSETSIEMAGNYTIDNINVELDENGRGIILWQQMRESGGRTLAVAQTLPEQPFELVTENLLTTSYLLGLPNEASIKLAQNEFEVLNVDNRISLIASIELGYPDSLIDYPWLISTELSFGSQLTQNVYTIRGEGISRLSCSHHELEYKCSGVKIDDWLKSNFYVFDLLYP